MLKKRVLSIAILLLSISIVCAQDKGVEMFDSFSIMPPGPPDDNPKISFELRDYESKELINDIHMNIFILDLEEGSEVNTLQYVDEEGILELRLDPGSYEIILKVDDLGTRGKDYYFKANVQVRQDIEQAIYLFPVGSLRGFVYDNDKAVNGADLKFECSGNYGDLTLESTDSFGSFSKEWLPLGSCRVIAEYGGKMGFNDVEIREAEIADVEINLSRSILGRPYVNWGLLLALLAVFVFVLFYKRKKPIQKEETQVELSPRTKDVLNTLKEKEKEVVDHLLENEYNSTQASIRNNTGIPKTSLARLFDSLEAKKVIIVEKIGKMKKIKLTEWFLGKE